MIFLNANPSILAWKVRKVENQNLSMKFYKTDLAKARHLLSVTTEVVSVSSLVMDATATVDAV